ncbi:MAG: pseudouridine-5'-phosphate glycosidase [Sporichthyaceae bacterium]
MNRLRIHPTVAEALAAGGPVVALESTVVTHGLPSPANLELARDLEELVVAAGAVPATVAVFRSEVHVGIEHDLLALLCDEAPTKLSTRDLAPALVKGHGGGTTVAATAHVAALAGIRLFATGGIGGVHRGARDSWDVSADLNCLAHTQIAVVCAGAKSILDVEATLEHLETLGVPVHGFGWRTQEFPAFYLRESGLPLDWILRSAEEAAETLRAHWDLGIGGGIVIANAVPDEAAMDPDLHDRALQAALDALEGVRGKSVTPHMLEAFHEATGEVSVGTNVALLKSNARVAAEIAVALATTTP